MRSTRPGEHTTAQLRAKHRPEASLLQQAVDHLTTIIGWPGFVALLSLAIFVWIAANLATAMSAPSDIDAVLEAIKELRDDIR